MDRAFMETYYTTYNSEDPQALRRFYADDVVLTSAQGELRGAEAILDTYRYLTAHCHDRMTPLDIRVDGARAVVTISDIFTAKRDLEDFMGQNLKQGESFELRLRGTYTASDGRFTHIVIDSLPATAP